MNKAKQNNCQHLSWSADYTEKMKCDGCGSTLADVIKEENKIKQMKKEPTGI